MAGDDAAGGQIIPSLFIHASPKTGRSGRHLSVPRVVRLCTHQLLPRRDRQKQFTLGYADGWCRASLGTSFSCKLGPNSRLISTHDLLDPKLKK